ETGNGISAVGMQFLLHSRSRDSAATLMPHWSRNLFDLGRTAVALSPSAIRLVLSAMVLGLSAPCTAVPPFEQFEDALAFSGAGGDWRARVSGTLDREGYEFSPSAPWLVEAGGEALCSPRLSWFIDAQRGPSFYGFAQARRDRGF